MTRFLLNELCHPGREGTRGLRAGPEEMTTSSCRYFKLWACAQAALISLATWVAELIRRRAWCGGMAEWQHSWGTDSSRPFFSKQFLLAWSLYVSTNVGGTDKSCPNSQNALQFDIRCKPEEGARARQTPSLMSNVNIRRPRPRSSFPSSSERCLKTLVVIVTESD